MGDEQALRLEGLLQSYTPRVAIVLLQRVEEIIPAVRESLVSVVSKRESCLAIVHGEREEKLSGKLMLICILH
jgi:hypothetical protein